MRKVIIQIIYFKDMKYLLSNAYYTSEKNISMSSNSFPNGIRLQRRKNAHIT